MPVKLERKLKREASAKGLSDEHADAYVYGTLRKTGWKPKRERKHLPGASVHEVITMDYTQPSSTYAEEAGETATSEREELYKHGS